jgi:hypothetical protein
MGLALLGIHFEMFRWKINYEYQYCSLSAGMLFVVITDLSMHTSLLPFLLCDTVEWLLMPHVVIADVNV